MGSREGVSSAKRKAKARATVGPLGSSSVVSRRTGWFHSQERPSWAAGVGRLSFDVPVPSGRAPGTQQEGIKGTGDV